ncbi:MAG: hypothetical protein PHE89_02020 [Alphaproteobacteria bacterium]|nr:hypothetical protein [Alphaproteobacteria bacterium]
MKKILLALLIVMFSTNIAIARPMHNNNPHRGGGYHQKAPVVIKEKRSKGDVWATGLISGIAGFVIGSNLSSSQNYYVDTPRYNSTTTIIKTNPEPNCVTNYDRWNGTTTTTCRSTPQYNNVVIVQ